MSSTASTEPAATSEQPARSPAKARKYNFGKPGGPRKSRRSSLEHKTGSITKPGKFGGGERQAEPPPEIRYEPLPLLRMRQTSCCRSCKSPRLGRPAAAATSCCGSCKSPRLRTSPASVVPPCGRTIRPVSACPNCLLLLLSLRSNSVVVLHVDFGLSNAPPCA